MVLSIKDAERQEDHDLRHWDGAARRQFTRAIVSGGAWIVIAKIVSQLSQIAMFLLAARMLSPADFGLFAFVSAIAMLLVVVAEGGWAEFLMKSRDGADCFDQVATISLCSGGILTIVGLIGTGLFCALTVSVEQSWLLALLSCWMLPAALTATFDGMLIVSGRLHQRALVRVAGELIGLLTAVALLSLGARASALAAAKIACQLVLLIGSAAATVRLPRLRLTASMFVEIIAFSRQIVGNRLVVFLGTYSGTLVVGSFLGVADAGFYRAAERVVSVLSELMGEPARSLSWVVFRRAHGQPGASTRSIGQAGVRFVLVLLAIAAPMYLGLAQISEPVVRLLLGGDWMPAATIIPFLCLRQLLLSPGYINEASLSVIEQIRYRLPITLLNVVVSLAAVIVFARYGLRELAIVQCFTAAFALASCIGLQSKVAMVDWAQISRGIILLILPASLLMIVTVMAVPGMSSDMSWRVVLFLQIATGALTYVLVLTALLGLSRRLHWLNF